MKTRIISGIIAIGVLFLVLSQFHTWMFNIVLFALYFIAVHEIGNAFKDGNVKSTSILLDLTGFIVLVVPNFYADIDYMVLSALLVAASAFIVVFNFDNIKFTSIASQIAFGLYVLVGFGSLLRFKTYLPYTPFGWDGVFLILCVAAISWGGDTFAYFSGYFFGKHKLAPTLSPKKTVEGAIGGVAGSVLLTWLFFWIYSGLKPILEHSDTVYTFDFKHLLVIGVIAAFGSMIGMIGDLMASAVKRQTGIKDYGNIMPGHGGVLDRFDSVLLVSPLVSSTLGFIVANGGIFNV